MSLGSSCVSKRQQLEELLVADLSRKAAASSILLPHISIIPASSCVIEKQHLEELLDV